MVRARSLTRIAALVALCASSALTQAAPVTQSVDFNAAIGANGTGAFTWDNDTLLMQNFHWDFGALGVGHIDDTVLSRVIFEQNTIGSVLYEVITGIHVNSFQASSIGIGGPFDTFPESVKFDSVGQYTFFSDPLAIEIGSQGVITVGPVAVSEPGTVALFAIAGWALLVSVRMRRRSPTS
jgi:hypothetical protein